MSAEIMKLINEKCEHRMKLETEKTDLEAQIKSKNSEISTVERFIIDSLQAQNIKAIDTAFGKFTVKVDSYASIKDQDALTAYLKELGIYESLVTLNAAKMNSYFKAEEEKAKEEQNIDFKIPGMEATSSRVKLSITGKKAFKVGASNE